MPIFYVEDGDSIYTPNVSTSIPNIKDQNTLILEMGAFKIPNFNLFRNANTNLQTSSKFCILFQRQNI
jgi:hypothetical protein